MITFLAGVLTGFAIFAIIVVLVDQFLYPDQDVNPIDIVGAMLAYLKNGAAKLVTRKSGSAYTEYEDYVKGAYEGDDDMDYINTMVEFCKEGER